MPTEPQQAAQQTTSPSSADAALDVSPAVTSSVPPQAVVNTAVVPEPVILTSAPVASLSCHKLPQWKVLPAWLQARLEAHEQWLALPVEQRPGRRVMFNTDDSLIGQNLSGCNLTDAHLAGIDLTDANLTGTTLNNADLTTACLKGANLTGAKLIEATLTSANLTKAILYDADLSKANLQNATLTDAVFNDAILCKADLTGATGLLPDHLAGSILAEAKLPPELATFDGLRTAEEMSKNSGKYFVAIMAACAYIVLTILTASDVGLFTESATATLPIIGLPINTVSFYWFAPVVLLPAYFYFHLDLQRLWDTLAKLPAVFVDGRTVDEKAYPWLLGSLARVYSRRLSNPAFRKENYKPLIFWQMILSILLAWYVVPMTLVLIWGQYIRRHEPHGTWWHIGLLLGSLVLAWIFRLLTTWTLKREGLRQQSLFFAFLGHWANWIRISMFGVGAAGLIFGSNALIHAIPPESPPFNDNVARVRPDKDASISGHDPRKWLSEWLGKVKYQPYARLDYANIATRPAGWVGEKKTEFKQVPVVLIQQQDLRYASLNSAFLVHANLSGTDLTGAQLTNADLRYATLKNAHLIANLDHAHLDNADLTKAHLSGAILTKATLSEATLTLAHLDHARIEGAFLKMANLTNADLSNAILNRADLNRAYLFGAHLSRAELSHANLSHANLSHADLKDANLSHANLSHADLRDTDLSHADLRGTNLSHANLRYANLRVAVLRDANLRVADLRDARLSHANLLAADLRDADLSDTSQSVADLGHADMSAANLSLAKLRIAHLLVISLHDADLSLAKLRGADLSDPDITLHQLEQAYVNTSTRFPDRFKEEQARLVQQSKKRLLH